MHTTVPVTNKSQETTLIPNQLAKEKSPYLLQHANNPVHWFPWGPDAFEKAEKENKPVFLSIGYSTCHWCHVMEHESFEDNQVATLLNDSFVSIKVDREERPDIDNIYMTVCQALTGQGGWPLTILMTPKQTPFYAGTYLPKTSRYSSFGMVELLSTVAEMWLNERDKLIQATDEIHQLLKTKDSVLSQKISKLPIHEAVRSFDRNYDPIHGGFGRAPKFPTPHNLMFLMRYAFEEKDSSSLAMAEKTLLQMYKGGMFDHIGGGFSRYSTDNHWLVPHFEKMLYDNALLMIAYSQAYSITHLVVYKNIIRKISHYILQELTDDKGGFYCGQDAYSEGVEGKYYVFKPEEVIEVLGPEQGTLFNNIFDITSDGNFEKMNIPNLLSTDALSNHLAPDTLQKIYDYRLLRTTLHKDDKVLTSWNSLMIAALCCASRAIKEPLYLDAAIDANHFINDYLVNQQGRLLVRWREGESIGEGKLDDYAFYAWAQLQLFESYFEVSYLIECIRITNDLINYFFDPEHGGFYFYASDGEQLLLRPKELYDGAIPSGNSVAALVLSKLYQITGNLIWKEYCDKQMNYIFSKLSNYPAGYSFSLLAVMNELYPSGKLVCVSTDNDRNPSLDILLSDLYLPNLTIIMKNPSNQAELKDVIPFTENYPIPSTGALYYLCFDNACSPPIASLEELTVALTKLIPQERTNK